MQSTPSKVSRDIPESVAEEHADYDDDTFETSTGPSPPAPPVAPLQKQAIRIAPAKVASAALEDPVSDSIVSESERRMQEEIAKFEAMVEDRRRELKELKRKTDKERLEKLKQKYETLSDEVKKLRSNQTLLSPRATRAPSPSRHDREATPLTSSSHHSSKHESPKHKLSASVGGDDRSDNDVPSEIHSEERFVVHD